jgi:hypothetical protein
MKYLIKQKHIYYVFIYKLLLEIVKEIFINIIIIFIFAFFYYISIHTYNFSNDNYQLSTIYITNIDELKPINQTNIWYKYFLGDFFDKFTSNSKTINHKFIQVKFEVKTLMPLEHNLDKKSIILNKIQSDFMKNLILECKYYKNKTSLLEIQLHDIKIAYINLIKDIDNITKEMN